MGSKARQWLFEWYWLVPIVIFLGLILSLSLGFLAEDNQRVWITAVTAGLAWTYFFQKQKLEEDKLFLDSFERFNQRFYELSDDLLALSDEVGTEEQENSDLFKPVVHKYFDLCIEEYQLYKSGRIPEATWRYWATGMLHLIDTKPAIEAYWTTMEKKNLCDGLTQAALNKMLPEKG